MTKHTGTAYWGTAMNRTRKVKLRLSLLRHDETNVELRLSGTSIKVDITMPTAALREKTDLARTSPTHGGGLPWKPDQLLDDRSLPGLPIRLFYTGLGLTVTDAHAFDDNDELVLLDAEDWALMMQEVCDLVFSA